MRLEAEEWKQKELVVRAGNLKEANRREKQRYSVPDKIVLAMTRQLGAVDMATSTGLKKGFLIWKCALQDRRIHRRKVHQVIHRITNGAMYKAFASLRLNMKLKKEARAKRLQGQRLEETQQRLAASALQEGPSRRFAGRRHPDYYPGDHHGLSHEGRDGGQFQNSSRSDLYRASTAPSSRTPHAFGADATVERKQHARYPSAPSAS